MCVMALRLSVILSVILSVTLWSGGCGATPLPLNVSLEGSAEGEEPGGGLIPTSFLPGPGGPPSESPTALDGSALLSQLAHFLQENLLLILVGLFLLVVAVAGVCCAAAASRGRKVNAYYPCSFPSKMYVDQRDRSGGVKPFNEVPERPFDTRQSEPPLDSGRQLQQDIVRAAKNLRASSSRAAPGECEARERGARGAAEERPQAEGSVAERTAGPCEPDGPWERSDSAGPLSGDPDPAVTKPAEQTSLGEEASAEGLSGPGSSPAQQQATPPAPEATPTAQEATPPSQEEDTPPVQQATPPAQQEATPPAQQDTPPAQQDTPPAQQDTPLAQEDTPPSQESTPPSPPSPDTHSDSSLPCQLITGEKTAF